MRSFRRFPLFTAVAALALGLVASPASAGVGEAIGDTLTVIQKPLLNLPALVTPGGGFEISCEAASSTTGWAAQLVRGTTQIPLTVTSAVYSASTTWWTLAVTVPAGILNEIYDLVVTANGGISDRTKHAVKVLPSYRSSYYFVQITDPHLPTSMYYYEDGAETDSTSMTDLRAVIDDINLINPEFVLLTGDVVNEGELEDYLVFREFTRAQRVLGEFQVPVFVTSGNHDLGGWDATPPPAGTSRKNWWRFFGWKRLANPPAGAPARTQDYSFDYGPVHFVGLEAYNNSGSYDDYLPAIYGTDSYRAAQLSWLSADLAAAGGSTSQVLFSHYDFQDQIDLTALGLEMSLGGHTHSNSGSITTQPYNLLTASVCDGKRAFRVVKVNNGVLTPYASIASGSSGTTLRVTYSPSNNGSSNTVTASVVNGFAIRFENALLKFVMPAGSTNYTVTNGTLQQVDTSGANPVCYVSADLTASATRTVSIAVAANTPPTVTVTAPNGGETWACGSVHAITWTATDDGGVTSITIERSLDNGGSWAALATGETNDGTYAWTVPATPSTQALVRVTAYDAAAQSGSDVSDAVFTIADQTAPTVTVTAPDGGETWDAGSTQAITWTATDNVAVAAVDLYWSTDNGASYTPIATGEANDGAYDWLVPETPTTEALVRVVAQDGAANSGQDASDAAFTIQSVSGVGDLPRTFGRAQVLPNRPNPFNPATVIGFGLPGPARVTITIYSVRGAVVRRLVDGEYGAGYSEARWDGRADDGTTVSSGTYFYRFRSGAVTETRRMVLTK